MNPLLIPSCIIEMEVYQKIMKDPKNPLLIPSCIIELSDGDFRDGAVICCIQPRATLTLDALIEELIMPKLRSVPPFLVKKVIESIESAISYIKDHNIFHRDLKPQNILYFHETNAFKVGDFDIATTRGDSQTQGMGTKSWIPPIRNEVPHIVDKWAVLQFIFYLCAGQHKCSNDHGFHAIEKAIESNRILIHTRKKRLDDLLHERYANMVPLLEGFILADFGMFVTSEKFQTNFDLHPDVAQAAEGASSMRLRGMVNKFYDNLSKCKPLPIPDDFFGNKMEPTNLKDLFKLLGENSPNFDIEEARTPPPLTLQSDGRLAHLQDALETHHPGYQTISKIGLNSLESL